MAKTLESNRLSGRIGGVFSPLRGISGLLLLVIAGCTTGPVANRGRVPDWSSNTPSIPTVDRTGLIRDTPVSSGPAVLPGNQPVPLLAQGMDTWVPIEGWCREKGFAASPVMSGGAPPGTLIRSREGSFLVRGGTTLGRWQGIELHLGYAPQVINGELCVNELDLEKTLLPLLARAPLKARPTRPVVVLDPGHGGHDSGTRSILSGQPEKEYTLDWARRLAGLLTNAGCDVLLTRTGDFDMSLSNRVAFADAHGASLFLSLHFNAAGPGGNQSGMETYCVTPSGLPSSFTRGYEDDPTLVFPNNQFDAANLHLACRVHQALLQVEGARDRGVRRARFLSVLRAQPRPAILIEGGFLSNEDEARRIANPRHRQQLAEVVAAAVQDWLSLSLAAGQ